MFLTTVTIVSPQKNLCLISFKYSKTHYECSAWLLSLIFSFSKAFRNRLVEPTWIGWDSDLEPKEFNGGMKMKNTVFQLITLQPSYLVYFNSIALLYQCLTNFLRNFCFTSISIHLPAWSSPNLISFTIILPLITKQIIGGRREMKLNFYSNSD